MYLVQNEQLKLHASALSSAGVAVWVAGLLVPLAGSLYAWSDAAHSKWWPALGLIWFATGIGLHTLGLVVLRRLRE